MGLLEFFIDLILPDALRLWGRLTLKQGSSLGGKNSRCLQLTILPHPCADCLEILGASASWDFPW